LCTRTKKAVSLKLKQDKQLRLQIVELENRLKRAENDTVSCKARVNSLKTQIQEKDRHIRDLELKLPRVLADISRSVGTNAVLTRNNTKNVRESMKRNNQLNLKVRELEQELRLKEKGEEKSNTHLNTIKVENIKLKAENCRLKADNTKLKAESKLAETAAREFRGVTDEKNKLTELLAELKQENTDFKIQLKQGSWRVRRKSVNWLKRIIIFTKKSVNIMTNFCGRKPIWRRLRMSSSA